MTPKSVRFFNYYYSYNFNFVLTSTLEFQFINFQHHGGSHLMQTSRSRTRYRPDGGDRYIPVRESESEWSMKYKSISKSSPSLDSNGTPNRKRARQHSTSSASGGSQKTSTSSSPVVHAINTEQSQLDLMTYKALLKNELLNHSIIDIVVFIFIIHN